MHLPSRPFITTRHRSNRTVLFFAVATFSILAGGGCANVAVWDQRLASKANKTFEDSAVFDYGSAAHASIEPGTAGSGGAQASGCTACK